MPTFVFDEEGVTTLAKRFVAGAESAEQLAATINGRIGAIRALERPPFASIVGLTVPGSDAANDLAVASALQSGDVNVELLNVAGRALGSLADIWREAATALTARVDQVRAATIDELQSVLDGDILLDIRPAVAEELFRISGVSVRDFGAGIPAPGEDPDIDAALLRFDSELLPAILSGELDPDSLTDRQLDDLELVTRLLGGDEQTFTQQRRDFVEVAGEDQRVIVETQVPFTRGPTSLQLEFVRRTVLNESARSAASIAVDGTVGSGSGGGGLGSVVTGGGSSGEGSSGGTNVLSFQPDFSDDPDDSNQADGSDVTLTEQPTGGGNFDLTITSESDGLEFSGSGVRFDGGGVATLTGTIRGIPTEVDIVVNDNVLQVETRSPLFDEPFAVTIDTTTGALLSDDPFVIDLEDLEKKDNLVDNGDNDDNDPFAAPNDETFKDDNKDGFDDGALSGGNDTDNPDIGGGLE